MPSRCFWFSGRFISSPWRPLHSSRWSLRWVSVRWQMSPTKRWIFWKWGVIIDQAKNGLFLILDAGPVQKICTPHGTLSSKKDVLRILSSRPVALHDPTAPTQLLVLGKPGDIQTPRWRVAFVEADLKSDTVIPGKPVDVSFVHEDVTVATSHSFSCCTTWFQTKASTEIAIAIRIVACMHWQPKLSEGSLPVLKNLTVKNVGRFVADVTW